MSSPYDGIQFVTRRSEIRNPDGTMVFEADGVVVPESWSQVATDILAQKYFRKAGVPARTVRVPADGVTRVAAALDGRCDGPQAGGGLRAVRR